MQISALLHRIIRKLRKIGLKPIRVFTLHQVGEKYDPLRCYECDWISLDSFRRSLIELRKEYTFISLSEAQERLKKDIIRRKQYAVLTFDDGYSSILPALALLEELKIPYTLFLNSKYLDGVSCSSHILENARRINATITEIDLSKGLYLNRNELSSLSKIFASFASHGYEHSDATNLSKEDFLFLINIGFENLNEFLLPIPFHAYTWGHHNALTDEVLMELGIIPVLMDGQKNYDKGNVIHRELFPKLD